MSPPGFCFYSLPITEIDETRDYKILIALHNHPWKADLHLMFVVMRGDVHLVLVISATAWGDFFPPPLNLNQLTFLRDPQIHFCILSVGFFQPSVPTFWQKSHQGSQCTIAMYVQPTGLTFLLLLQSPEGLPLTWDSQVDVCRCVFQIYHFR